jgi:DNA-binding GntR family transcriptional regulator
MPGGGGKKGRKPTTSANRNLSRADFVYQRLRNGIRSGDFRPGDRMREAVLAAKLKVSRTPIREAIRRLASEGFLEVAASRGVMIVELNKQQVREVYALREALEGTAARFAAQHASPSEIAEMRELLEHSAGKDTTPEASAKFNRLFHSALHDAAHNRYLAQALQQLYDSLALLPGTTFAAPGRAQTAHAEHLALLTAIEKRDADKADQLARDHIRAAGQIRMRMMFETPGD